MRVISLPKIHHQKLKEILLAQIATQKVKVISLPKIHHTKSNSSCPKHLAPVADEMVLELLEPHHLPDLLPITSQGGPPLQNNFSHILSGLHLEQKNDLSPKPQRQRILYIKRTYRVSQKKRTFRIVWDMCEYQIFWLFWLF